MRNMPRLPSGSWANGTSSIGGDHAHQMAGKIITIVPSQKLGVASPMMATDRPT